MEVRVPEYALSSSSVIESPDVAAQPVRRASRTPLIRRIAFGPRFRTWYWLAIPILAIVAYAPALRIGFLSDDYSLLWGAGKYGDLSVFVPSEWVFYRPLSTILTWEIGWHLWGLDPLPYHLISLLLHALTSLIVGLWLAEASKRYFLGWLGGLLFAVFPVHLEAVGWLASQWDLWATLFVLSSLLFFTKWWRKRNNWYYFVSLLFYAFAIYSKESVLTFLPIFPLSAWLSTAHIKRSDWIRMGLYLIPFVLVLASNLGLRLIFWGTMRGYPAALSNVGDFFWDKYLVYIHMLLAPINAKALGDPRTQVTGLLCTVGIVSGLVLYGHIHKRLFLMSALWIGLTLAPVLNLINTPDDLTQNRYLYLPAVAYCATVAAILYSVVSSIRRRAVVISAVISIGMLLVLSMAVTWFQLRPWHIATLQLNDVTQELYRLVPPPPKPRSRGMIWYVEKVPDNYQGAYVLRVGLDATRGFMPVIDWPIIEYIPDAARADLTKDERDSYALRFGYSQSESRFHVIYAAGLTRGASPPSQAEFADNPLLWDFRQCSSAALQAWQLNNANLTCQPEVGLSIQSVDSVPQMEGPNPNLIPPQTNARFLRLRIAATYLPSAEAHDPPIVRLLWRGSDEVWDGTRSISMSVKDDKKPHVYWYFVPISNSSQALSKVRLEVKDGPGTIQVNWIAIDSLR